jgi:hypothetical protein
MGKKNNPCQLRMIKTNKLEWEILWIKVVTLKVSLARTFSAKTSVTTLSKVPRIFIAS